MQCSKLQSLSHQILNFVIKNKEQIAFSTGNYYEGEDLYMYYIHVSPKSNWTKHRIYLFQKKAIQKRSSENITFVSF